MFRLLLFLARGLKGVNEQLARIADALDRAIPTRAERDLPVYVVVTDPEADEARVEAYQRHLGRELFPDEQVPDNFNPDDPRGIFAAFLGAKKGH